MAGVTISSTPGLLVVLRQSGVKGVIRIRGGSGGRLSNSSVLITKFGFSHSTNTQFMNTLRNAIYVYSFGDNMGSVQFGGLVFLETCFGSGAQGVNDVIKFYAKNRASITGKPTIVGIGSYVFRGLMTQMQLGVTDTEHKILSFTYVVRTVPQ